MSKKFLYLLDIRSGVFDLVGFRTNKKTGVLESLRDDGDLAVTSTGLEVDVHAMDPKGKYFVAASTSDALVRAFAVGKKDGFPDVPQDAVLTSPTLLTGIAVIKP